MTLSLRAELLHALETRGQQLAVDAGKDATLSYDELGKTAAWLASQIGPHQSIGILSNRRSETYVAVMACFLSGKKFAPLNPAFPEGRLRKIIELADVGLVVCDGSTAELAASLSDEHVKIPLNSALKEVASGQDLGILIEQQPDESAIAYQMFTSGSTGEPKGVPIPYEALDHYVRTIRECVSFPQNARFSQFFDLSFDLSIHDIFVTFACGGTLVPASDLNLMMPHSFVAKREIDVWFSVPMLAMSAARGLRSEPDHKLSLALFCGEALPMDYVRNFRALMRGTAPLWNLYGPTEATIAFTAKQVDENDLRHTVATLGEPFGDNRIAVLTKDEQVRPVEEEVRGELLLGGPQVFSGYQPPRHDPFVQAETGPFYRSGDIVRMEDGELVYEGRADNQVKVRGMRIELNEIESAFRNHLGCDAAAAIVYGEFEAAELRVAYTKTGDPVDPSGLSGHLPPYMVPARAWQLDELPVNANGKVDRRKLGELEWPE